MRKKRPSAPMVLSIIALVFAVAGTGVAGVATISVLNKKEKKQTRNIAKDEIEKAAPGLSVANAGALDGKPASAYQQKARWAHVNSDGTILAQSGGITASNPSPGLYFVDFGAPTTGMFVSGTGRGAGTIVTAAPCGGPPLGTNCTQGDDPNHLVVNLRNEAGSPVGERFFVGVFP